MPWGSRHSYPPPAGAPSKPRLGGSISSSNAAPTPSAPYPNIEITREADDGDPGPSGEKVMEGRLRDV
jgi:hypothetical protein